MVILVKLRKEEIMAGSGALSVHLCRFRGCNSRVHLIIPLIIELVIRYVRHFKAKVWCRFYTFETRVAIRACTLSIKTSFLR